MRLLSLLVFNSLNSILTNENRYITMLYLINQLASLSWKLIYEVCFIETIDPIRGSVSKQSFITVISAPHQYCLPSAMDLAYTIA